MLDKLTWNAATYNTTNYAVDSTKPTASTYYVISWWTSLTLANLCTAPTTASTLKITSIWSPTTTAATNATTANAANQTYACWYARTLYDLTLTKNTWIETLYYKVNGASSFASTWTSATIKMKAWSDASVYAVASNCYTYTATSSTSPQSWTNITASKSFSPTAIENTNNITYNMNGWTNNASNPATYKITQLPITLQQPTKTWYTFKWWTGANGTTAQTDVTIAGWTCGALTYNAVWQANTNTPYTVYHYVKKVWSGTYELVQTEPKQWTSDAILTLSSLARADGFVCATYDRWSLTWTENWPWEIVTQTTINWDGSTKIYLYYTRNNRTVHLSGDEHVDYLEIDGVVDDEAVRECGSEVPVNAIPKPWYHFVRWRERERTEEEEEEKKG